MQERHLTKEEINAIENVISKGVTAKVIPVRYGVVVKNIKEKTVYEPVKREK